MTRDRFPGGYAGEEFQAKEPLMLISIRVTYGLWDDPYDAVRYAWRVSLDRVAQHKLVLAHVKGTVVGAYRPTQWLPATRENFPDQAKRYGDVGDRLHLRGFVGKPAEQDVWDYYVSKRAPKLFLGARNAVRYLNPEDTEG